MAGSCWRVSRQVMTVLVLSSVKWVLRVSERLINEDDVLILAPGRSGGIVPAPCGSSCQMKMDVLLVQCRSLWPDEWQTFPPSVRGFISCQHFLVANNPGAISSSHPQQFSPVYDKFMVSLCQFFSIAGTHWEAFGLRKAVNELS